MVHGVTPPAALHEADGCTTGRMNTPSGLQLREATIIRRDHDVAGQRNLDAKRKGNALHRSNNGFTTGAAQCQGIHWRLGALLHTAVLLHAFCPLGQIEPRGKVISVAKQHAHKQVVALVQPRKGLHQLLGHRWRVAIVFCWAIQPDQQDGAALLDADRTL